MRTPPATGYTERYILRRLARFNRSEATLTTLAGLYRSTDSPDTPGESETAAESGEAGSDRGDGPEQQSAPVESTGAAYNRLSPILSGERVPTWTLTRRPCTCARDGPLPPT
ncbi:hypothetical protein ABZ960_39405 [Streptomyces pseudovenezuelae]|uniref:hypothetical protein n=1 Tax=Streptomyces pseudovenezuelae TaxID=67350 RepID=UPI0034A2DA7F